MHDEPEHRLCRVAITIDVDTDNDSDVHYLAVWAHARCADLVMQLRERGIGAGTGGVSIGDL